VSLRIRRIVGDAEFAALAPLWDDLANRSGQQSPFMSHDWFACCWSLLAPHRRLEVLLVEEVGAPVALVPLMQWRERRRGMTVRSVGFIESPDTPWVDMLVAGSVGPVVEAVLDHFAGRSDWDVLQLNGLPSGSAALKALEHALPGRFLWRRGGSLTSPFLTVGGDWEDFYAAKSQRFKKTNRNIQNRLARAGLIGIEEHRALAPDSPLLADVFDLSARSWKADRGLAMATMRGMREFFADLTRRATERGWLSLWLLTLNGRPTAMEYQLRAGGIVHALRADYDEAQHERSPGSALNFAIAKALFKRGGVHEYDMGPGENDYKLRWASGSHETMRLRIYRRGLYPRLVHAVETVVVPAARRLRERLR